MNANLILRLFLVKHVDRSVHYAFCKKWMCNCYHVNANLTLRLFLVKHVEEEIRLGTRLCEYFVRHSLSLYLDGREAFFVENHARKRFFLSINHHRTSYFA